MQLWGLELVVCIHLTVVTSCKCLCNSRDWLQAHTQWWGSGNKQGSGSTSGTQAAGGMGLASCHALIWMLGLTMGTWQCRPVWGVRLGACSCTARVAYIKWFSGMARDAAGISPTNSSGILSVGVYSSGCMSSHRHVCSSGDQWWRLGW